VDNRPTKQRLDTCTPKSVINHLIWTDKFHQQRFLSTRAVGTYVWIVIGRK
jgi:hypothetical protein